MARTSAIKHSTTLKIFSESQEKIVDHLCVEEPLLIYLSWDIDEKRQQRAFGLTMRTPGDDESLAVGLLYAEGLIRQSGDILSIDRDVPDENKDNTINVYLKTEPELSGRGLDRQFSSYSACGVCGKTSLKAIEMMDPPVTVFDGEPLSIELIQKIQKDLSEQQSLFIETGGSHASALFSTEGELLAIKEDIGRHNALDKLIGHQLQYAPKQLADGILLVSGRASFELMQKTVMAGIPFMIAVGAPSSMALMLAQRFDITLIGFLRDDRFNVYHGQHRIDLNTAGK